MSPTAQRWRPRRAGIINLYEYANQVFDFAGGRLLLRGHNTSGKTKALELLLPFCLDGDISPNKLDPFASAYKDMKWNLIGCCAAEKRTGYVWLEFERLETDGSTRLLTVGIGMRANRDLPNVVRWYFVARDRAVGRDLHLLRGREPINKADLTAAIAEHGDVLDSQSDYRARLNDLLFGFTGEEQYQTMLRLMRDLRRPHLSKTLDPARVAEQLSAGLPEVDRELMRKLAGGLDQLETLERGLARLRDVRERVRRFHQRTYSAYARAIVRERAEALRQASSAVEGAAERLRDARAELEARVATADAAATARDGAAAEVIRLDAEERALISDDAWSSVVEVERLRDHAAAQGRAAAEARRHADHLAETASALEAELITARAALEELRTQADQDLAGLTEHAGRAGMGRRADALHTQLLDRTLDAATWRSLVAQLVSDWHDVLHRHRELLTAALKAADAAERARVVLREAAERLSEAVAKRAAADEQLEHEREAYAAAFATWRVALVELMLSEPEVEAAIEAANDGGPPAGALSSPIERVRGALADERAAQIAARDAARSAIATFEAEIERLAAAHDDGPRAPEWDRASRVDRAGAPLWRLIDFRDGESDEQRAGLEAALEASGLLDAWITPTGQVEDHTLADVVLEARAPVDGESLLDAVVAVPDQLVAAHIVAQVLATIGLGTRDGGPWLERDGCFSIGPLRGRGAKASAEHVGAAAREARRRRQIAERRQLIALHEVELAAVDARLSAIDARRVALDGELATVPPVDAIAAALQATRLMALREADAARTHDAAAGVARLAADEEVAADAARREHAAGHDLPAGLDQRSLDQMRDATVMVTGALSSVARAWTRLDDETSAATALAERLGQQQANAVDQDQRARGEKLDADRLLAEYDAREAALGTTGEEIRRRHRAVVEDLQRARQAERTNREAAEQARIAAAGLQHDVTARAQEHEAARGAREQASIGFRQLAEAEILQLVLEEASPSDVAVAGGWTFSRALEVARALPAELLAVRSSAGEREVEVQRAVQLLDRELADADMGAYATRGADGLLIVSVTEGGATQSLAQIMQTLADEIADREHYLSAEERRVFSDALVEELGEHLRGRIHDVRGRVARMNTVLARSPTAAGKTVELDWRPREGDDDAQQRVLTLLRRDVRRLDEQARDDLIAFFRGRIDAARRDQSVVAEPRPMSETLMDAFDYRNWFVFELRERSSAGLVRLSKQRHAVGSGGEQAVLIHLPLFAAAAALYGDSTAPRLIMLDEALSGIDDDTRERVMKATVDFDLDLMMTSHELWGTYASVPQLAIYQLHRENGVFGVHAIPFLWDGAVLHELEQDSLLV